MDFTREEFRRLNKFDRIYILVSGGKDSTYTVLKMFELRNWIKKPVILLNHDTGMEMASARIVLEQLSLHTGWKLEIVSVPRKPKPMDLVKKAIRDIPKARDLLLNGTYSKKVFTCCYNLKEKPFMEWLKKKDHRNDVFILSIKLGDSWRRRKWLLDLIEDQEKFSFNRQKQVWYYYPLRDTVTKDLDWLLTKEKFWNVKRTGCRICPILILFELEKGSPRYERSRKVQYDLMIGERRKI